MRSKLLLSVAPTSRRPSRRHLAAVLLYLLLLLPASRAQLPQPEQPPHPSAGQVEPAQSSEDSTGQDQSKLAEPDVTPSGQEAPSSKPPWQYGGFIDAAYLLDFNHPSNHLFRSRGTAYKVDEPILNMAGVYLRKPVSDSWGMELTVHAGQDSRVFGFSATAPNLPGSKWLRHLGPTNVSYLAPVGDGLTLQAGIFSSFIGYDSLYARDNFNYTRPWGADYTPYLMLGVNARYPLSDRLTGTLFVVNGYWHLANANSVPSFGGQLAYQPTGRVTLKQTVLFGPHQQDTSLKFSRFLSDSIAEWKGDKITVAFEYQIATEKVAVPGSPRAFWSAAQMPVHWNVRGPWSLTVRPEFAWDSEGRWTGFEQTIKAFTTTLEYRLPYRKTNTILRLEHRYDDSRGRGGGFFRGAETQPGVVGLTPTQHLLLFGVILTFDSSFRP
ncbi:MAG: porin [Acidobacteria bacterium]|nr:porin [Acidobacteriota bacterium]